MCNFAAFCSKNSPFWQNLHYFSSKAWELKMVILHIFIWSFLDTKQKSISKKCATLTARAAFVCAILLLFALKTALFWLNWQYFSCKAWELKMVILHIFNWSFDDTKQKSISKKVCYFGCQSCFCMPNLAAFCSKKALFDKIYIIFPAKHENSKR